MHQGNFNASIWPRGTLIQPTDLAVHLKPQLEGAQLEGAQLWALTLGKKQKHLTKEFVYISEVI